MTSGGWRVVEEFDRGGVLRAVADAVGGTRYESDSGAAAVVVPGEAVGVHGDVVFVERPEDAEGLAGELVALPSGTPASGLGHARSGIAVADDRFDLYHARDTLAVGRLGEVGEDESGLERRSEWFERRHGSTD
ncbi:hypothetical protein [Saccharothrix luteola]|uniref:hypothetical protein n=1 Tax=Saccharothrix luteola TaxID=2893018 RepID=UPI001E3B2E66|nr:hypothetical protein [Saccharothrix luteola]MCC8246421.1 hypothetical protein [Saccharothrix luteola]